MELDKNHCIEIMLHIQYTSGAVSGWDGQQLFCMLATGGEYEEEKNEQ